MQRWVFFNAITGTKQSLNQQVLEIVRVKIRKQKNVDVESLAKSVREWLEEEVEWVYGNI